MYRDLRYALASLTIYRNFLKEETGVRVIKILDCILQYGKDSLQAVESYHDFVAYLYQKNISFDSFLLNFILHDDNPFSREAEFKPWQDIDEHIIKATQDDLHTLQKLYYFNWAEIYPGAPEPVFECRDKACFPRFFQTENWVELIHELASYYAQNSRGIVAVYKALRWQREKGLIGIRNPEPCRMEELLGLDYQIRQLCLNTEFFLQGYPANNVLLYGPRGTGKSTMIKALLDRYAHTRLRLIELKREDLGMLPDVVENLREYNLKFIIYIDDLSFEDYETEYKGLKAVLEGNIQGRSSNVLVYATSNRRHLVKEYFSDRIKTGEEVHLFDTMEEKLSLADRFGLVITVPSPDRETYLKIVYDLADKRGLKIDRDTLTRKAIEWERSHHGFSGRTARQFVDSLGEYYKA